MRTLLLAAATLATPTHVKVRPILALGGAIGAATFGSRPLRATVDVIVDEFRPIPPEEAYESLILEAAAQHNLDPDLIRAVMRTESSFNAMAVSPVGAQGLMQLMPSLAKDMGVTDPFDPRQNIMAGARYLRKLLDAHDGNIELTLASYNAGPGNVKRYKGIPPFRETRNYVQKITDLLEEASEE